MNLDQLFQTHFFVLFIALSCAACGLTINGDLNSGNTTTVSAPSFSSSQYTVNFNSALKLTVSGGKTPFTYSIVSGGGTIGASTGTFFSSSYKDTTVVKVTDANGETSTSTIQTEGSKLYVLGGWDGASALGAVDIVTASGSGWTAGLGLPVDMSDHGAVVFKNKVWIMGGYKNANIDEVYSTSDVENWNLEGNLPAARGDFSISVFNEKLWIVGGTPDNGTSCTNTVWSSSDGITWTVEANFPVAVCYPSSVVWNGKLWVIGGNNGGTVYSSVYSTSDGVTWTLEGNLPAARTGGGVTIHDGKVWYVGGGNGPCTAQSSVYYSSDMTNWSTATAIPATRTAPGVSSFDGKLWIMGGDTGCSTSYAHVWSSTDGTAWSAETSLNNATGWIQNAAIVFTVP